MAAALELPAVLEPAAGTVPAACAGAAVASGCRRRPPSLAAAGAAEGTSRAAEHAVDEDPAEHGAHRPGAAAAPAEQAPRALSGSGEAGHVLPRFPVCLVGHRVGLLGF